MREIIFEVFKKRIATIDSFLGAPLDCAKLAGAVFMVADHANLILLKGEAPGLRLFGRIAFPLFCFVLACHLIKEFNIGKYVARLIVFGALTQPIFSWAFLGAHSGNILFTLAVGATLAEFLNRQTLLLQHLILAIASAAIFFIPYSARSGVDFGMAGMFFTAPILLILNGKRSHVIWLFVLAIGLNARVVRPVDLAWFTDDFVDLLVIVVGTSAVLAFCLTFAERRRFLPRYVLYVFYPAHLAILAGMRSLLN